MPESFHTSVTSAVPKDMDYAIAPHFTYRELACRCCGSLHIEPKLLLALEWVRCALDCPLIITSGYRCPQHNLEIGSKNASQHRLGTAADIAKPKTSFLHIYDTVRHIPIIGGLGIYPQNNFFHIDVRPRVADTMSMWGFRNGTYVPIKDVLS